MPEHFRETCHSLSMGTMQKVTSCLSSWASVFEDVGYVGCLFLAKKVIMSNTSNSVGGFMD